MNSQKTKYLIRLDDASPFMHRGKWKRIEEILGTFGVMPLVGIIPDAREKLVLCEDEDPTFWEKALSWQDNGWSIALHGYDHCYISDGGLKGLNPMWDRSEFAGVPLSVQQEKIRKGVMVLKAHGIEPKYFFAPSHTFDENTLEALRLESEIRIISDTIATKPYKYKDFVIIPQLGGHCSEMKIPGIWTFCLHPSNMEEKQFVQTEEFIRSHKHQFVSFNDLDLTSLGGKSLFSRILSWSYFIRRRLHGAR